MLLRCDISIADLYTSQSQRSRVISEAWFRSFGYCLSCDSEELRPTAANTKASDFVCPECDQSYELKSFALKPRRSLADGAYSAMMARIKSGEAPTLMLLERSQAWDVRSLTAVHGKFLTPNVIVQRRALSTDARRAGWVGCNIRLDLIAADAQISVVEDGRPSEPDVVRSAFRLFNRIGDLSLNARGWATLTLRVIRSIGADAFSLDDLYRREQLFSRVYPMNRNVRAKIRQQLQVLRDLRYVEFCGKGTYRLLI
ncbi:MAG: DpnI domain-containing protein [Terracidiphilus sp.]|jgi:type II restriction enzyme